jgi:hypothetical protein
MKRRGLLAGLLAGGGTVAWLARARAEALEGRPDAAFREAASTELARFLVRAKRSTYASRDSSLLRAQQGGHEVGFSDGPFRYLDRYFGETRFAGQEVVWRGERPLWSLIYRGTTAEDAPGGFPAFHKAALRQVTEEAPFRGPARYRDGELVYVNDIHGSIREVSGSERVIAGGREVFRLAYEGGLIG